MAKSEGKIISQLIINSGYSDREIAEDLGTTVQSVGRWRHGGNPRAWAKRGLYQMLGKPQETIQAGLAYNGDTTIALYPLANGLYHHLSALTEVDDQGSHRKTVDAILSTSTLFKMRDLFNSYSIGREDDENGEET